MNGNIGSGLLMDQRGDNACDEDLRSVSIAPAIEMAVDPSTDSCHGRNTKRNLAEYNARKPKWWSRLSGNPSRAQKRATNMIFPTHRLPDISFGNYLSWNTFFPPETEIWMEIGSGRGENLLALAHRKCNDNIGLVGIEINRSGMGTVCQRIQQGLSSGSYWSDYTLYSPSLETCNTLSNGSNEEHDAMQYQPATANRTGMNAHVSTPYRNLRLYPGDGVKLFSKIPTSSVTRILVTFPDPFPFDHEKQWRLVQVSTLKEMHRILRKSKECPGTLFLATDHEGYHDWCQEVMDRANAHPIIFEKVDPCPDRLEWMPAVSHYERKGWGEGRRTLLSCWMATS